MSELAILGEAAVILTRIWDDHRANGQSVEMAALGRAALQLLLDNTMQPHASR